jgi:UDP-N-acetylglucosamine 2-epimerase
VASFLQLFDVEVDIYLAAMVAGQSLASLTARILLQLDSALIALHQKYNVRPALALVQGDTTTVAATAMVAYYHHIMIGHVEAGLRTYDMSAPFPEELNRQLASTVSTLHFAPTQMAAQTLLNEGFPGSSVFVTGNTAIDSTLWQLGRLQLPSTCNHTILNQPLNSGQKLSVNISSSTNRTVLSMGFFVQHGIARLLHKVDQHNLQQKQACTHCNLEGSEDIDSQNGNQPTPFVILLTCHRRENFGAPMRRIFQAIKALLVDVPKQ